MGDYLLNAEDKKGIYDFCMVGYALENTLSENGSVARGICERTPDSYLTDIRERTRIEKTSTGIQYTEDGVNFVTLEPGTIVSLNTWGFTPSIMKELDARFPAFLKSRADNLLKAEYFLPNVVGDLVKEGKATVKVLPTNEKWFGVTYREDRPVVQSALRELIAKKVYPESLWAE